MCYTGIERRQPNLKLKIWPKYLLGDFPLDSEVLTKTEKALISWGLLYNAVLISCLV